jgi:uncharacterized protein (TIGR03437 family)
MRFPIGLLLLPFLCGAAPPLSPVRPSITSPTSALLLPTHSTWAPFPAPLDSGGFLPTSLAGMSVQIGGQPAPLLYASASQAAAIVPVSASGNPAVQIFYRGLFSPLIPVTVVSAVPGLFSANASGSGQGAALNQDGSVNSVAHPTGLGTIVSLYCSGCGVTSPPGVDGAISTAASLLANAYSVMIGNQSAQVLYAGAAPDLVNGAVQINARIPAGVSGDAVPVSISVAGSPCSPPVTVAVH